MRVKLQLQGSSEPVEHRYAKHSYTYEGLYCVQLDDRTIRKYPIQNILSIEEED